MVSNFEFGLCIGLILNAIDNFIYNVRVAFLPRTIQNPIPHTKIVPALLLAPT